MHKEDLFGGIPTWKVKVQGNAGDHSIGSAQMSVCGARIHDHELTRLIAKGEAPSQDRNFSNDVWRMVSTPSLLTCDAVGFWCMLGAVKAQEGEACYVPEQSKHNALKHLLKALCLHKFTCIDLTTAYDMD